MSTHNICFCQEIRKILCGYPLLSVAMYNQYFSAAKKALSGAIYLLYYFLIVSLDYFIHTN